MGLTHNLVAACTGVQAENLPSVQKRVPVPFRRSWIESAHGPFMVSGEPTGPEFGARDVAVPKQISEERMRRRLNLRQGVEEELRRIENDPDDPVSNMDTFYRQALEMVTSPTARAALTRAAQHDSMTSKKN